MTTSTAGFDTEYAVRDGAVYYCDEHVAHADPATTEILGGIWAVDRQHVFRGGSRTKIDRSTFRYLNRLFVIDYKTVYDCSGPIKGAEPTAFVALDPGITPEEGDEFRETANGGYGRDDKQVFYHDPQYGRSKIVRAADPATFQSFRNGYGADSRSVFWGQYRLKGSHPPSWVYLGRGYSADRERVFNLHSEMPGVRRATFAVVGLRVGLAGTYATDGHRCFWNGSEIPAKQFVGLFEQYIKDLTKWLAKDPLMRQLRDR